VNEITRFRRRITQTWKAHQISGTHVVLVYKTTYTRGETEEQFVFQIQNGAATFVGYHVNSNALVIN
jgi:hypothetical protein